ncbi:MAG TPA: beta-N-acetylhexosaminidase [Streptosporangiaceae bacterium]|nr:beta-N-acetylhexosaminidase [Streptosporangiaceae bacterium]
MNDRLTGLVPHPASVRPMPGTLALTAHPATIAADRDAGLADALSRALAAVPWPETTVSPDQKVTATVESATDLPPEAYRLTIADTGLSIAAGGVQGAFYAAQTLRHLLPADAWRAATPAAATATPADWRLPCAVITDTPALAWRGAHLDVARHFFPKREILALIDAFAALKLNRLHLHLTDDQGWRIESRRYPALHEIGSHRPRTRLSLGREDPVYDGTPHGGYYTLADLAEISAYAAQRMITVVPEIDVPGHASALLAACPELGAGPPPPGGYQVLADWGIFPYLMSPLPRTRGFLRDIFGELLEAVPAPYVHIGGDECVLDAWRDDPEVDSYRRQRGLAGPAELHAAFLREVADLLADDFGARAVVWDEGFASADATPERLRPDTIVMAWRGMDIGRRAAAAGHDVIAAPVLPTYFDYFQSDDDTEPGGIGGPVRLADVAAFVPVPPDWPEEARRHLIGTQFQVWTEYIRTSRELEYMIFPRACALADVAWSGAPVPPGASDGRLAAHLRRLDAAGLEYRPLSGPRPGQQGGTGARRHRPGAPIGAVAAHLDKLAAGGT